MSVSGHRATNGPSRVTLKDVATRVGLSTATVSLALNGRGTEVRISAESLKRIQKAAAELGYRANWRARALASQRSHLVAYASAGPSPLTSGLNEQINAGVCTGLVARGYYPVIVPLIGDRGNWTQVISPDRVDGCILAHPLPDDPVGLFDRSRLPMVAVNTESKLPIVHVVPDDVNNAKRVTEHLIAAGHRRIVYVTPSNRSPFHFSVTLRQKGYRLALSAAGLKASTVPFSVQEPGQLLGALASKRPCTAAVVYDHWLAIDILAIAREAGIRLPERLSIVTFNQHDTLRYSYLPLTTIATPGEAIGRKAAELLVDEIVAPRREQSHQVIRLDGELVVRNSVIRMG